MDIEITLEKGKKVYAHTPGHVIETDQAIMSGGDDSAPAPFTLFLASIGTCAGIYVKSFCDQRNIPTDHIKIIQRMEFNPATHMIGKVILDIKLPADFPEKYKDAVIKSADMCAVKKHMQQPPEFEVFTSVN